ncbi:ABC transporter substrate-binding protein [Azospirillum agricola]|uniref:ABC transporter substrate-binding protein n=1 Tax=Azospirillum agricola TaxID=1720247 RepID=UPI000A0F222A|nr:ABC transporter substrate-binding protein [Azospirillum agricola]SMH60376.1 amino acid/amide ABC transporter substrate-binding protein, HAAT family (TC 3.A.1.4.-) [Azospirillum lipoferum]
MRRAAFLALGLLAALPARAETLSFPVLVPLTGFLSLEGTSQRNGAALALTEAGAKADVIDTGTSPEAAVTALERAAGNGSVGAVAASMLGTQMLAMLPLAAELKLPLVTVSGTASITEQGNPWVFRFFPGDAVTKTAHARYVVEELGRKRPALIYQTTAYGQSGKAHLEPAFKALGAELVFEEGVDPAAKDLLPVLTKALAAKPDVLVLHLHSGPTALLLKQAAASGVTLPIVAGSAMHQPSTAALLEPAELKGVCAETAASPISGGSPAMEAFTASYRAAFGKEPDAFALGQYDGMRMVLAAVRDGAKTAEDIRKALAGGSHAGLAMTYKSDGKGNMAHSAVIVCYDGTSRVPALVKRYNDVAGVVK